MGMAHVLYVYEESIVHSRDSETERTKYAEPLGHAVLELCLNPLYERTEKGPARVTSENLFNHGNCVNWVDEVHST
jgi:hypothetical protein